MTIQLSELRLSLTESDLAELSVPKQGELRRAAGLMIFDVISRDSPKLLTHFIIF